MNEVKTGAVSLQYEEEPRIQTAIGIHVALNFLEKQALGGGYDELAFFVGVAALAAEDAAIREIADKTRG
ncbi:MAG: hypothetical protein M0006_02630 [Magnetospirillum sp.]|nr:hypothetical protein [Magnetospirillum sp.]